MDALITHQKLDLLTAMKFRLLAPEGCPVVFDDCNTSVVREEDRHGDSWLGQKLIHCDEWHGIVRTVTMSGSIIEAQFKNGKKHGFCRSIGSDGTYRHEYYQNNKLNGTRTIFNPSGDILSQSEFKDDKEVGAVEDCF